MKCVSGNANAALLITIINHLI